ncbi:hypothetical protein NE237_000901 [Protea cynaroides]|uniref:Uncharacterized protein n=1 Tax=Protea cynaroides TaxID=273540 RepID=A0A9Q0QXX7_9MAGN|nr:hypothetical protein NE237_000901 [Protea cynaroides]
MVSQTCGFPYNAGLSVSSIAFPPLCRFLCSWIRLRRNGTYAFSLWILDLGNKHWDMYLVLLEVVFLIHRELQRKDANRGKSRNRRKQNRKSKGKSSVLCESILYKINPLQRSIEDSYASHLVITDK